MEEKLRAAMHEPELEKELLENNWTICSKFTCPKCPIELNCPFDQLIDADHEGDLIRRGFIVLQGPGGMWGVFKKQEITWGPPDHDDPKFKLRMLNDDEW